MEEDVKEGWHLNKSVPLTLIAAIILQTGTFVWFMSDLRNDVDNNSVDITELKAVDNFQTEQLRGLSQTNNKQAVLLGQIEVELRNITSLLTKLEERFNE